MISPKPENPICTKCKDEEGRPRLISWIGKDGSKIFGWRIAVGKKCMDKYNSEQRKKARDYWKRKSPFSQASIKKFGETKKCTPMYCNKEYPKTVEHWVTNPTRKDGLHSICRHCLPDSQLFKNYGIRQTDKNGIHKFQKSRCGICSKEISTNGDANVDHDADIGMGRNGRVSGLTVEQKRNSVNGLLCVQCNRALGIIKKGTGLNIKDWALLALAYEENPPAQAYFQSLKVKQQI